MKKFLIIAGTVVLIIIIAGGIFIYANRDKLANIAVEQGLSAMETTVLRELPQSVSPDSVRLLFNRAKINISTGKADKQVLQDILKNFQDGLSDKMLDSLEVATILAGVRQLGKEKIE